MVCKPMCQLLVASRYDRVYTQQECYVLKIIFSKDSMQDNCVYARNLLGRLVSTYGSSASHQYSQSQTPSQDSFVTPGALMVIGAILLMLFMSLRNRKKMPQSQVQ